MLKRREKDQLRIIPIIIRPCAWHLVDWLKKIQCYPKDAKPLSSFRGHKVDENLATITEVTYKILTQLQPKVPSPAKLSLANLPLTEAYIFGREKELLALDAAWEDRKINIVSLVAWGGVGKTALVNKWLSQIAKGNYRGAKRVFAWSFYSQGTGDRVTSADLFIAEALKWFGDPNPTQGSPWDKGERLAELVQREKTLLLLDGMEPIQSSLDFERGKIKDPALAVLVTELAKENPGLCVITTREPVFDLANFSATTQEIHLKQISAEAGRALLRVGGVHGTDGELEQAARDFDFHALALNLLATYIYEIPGHHISNVNEIPDLDVLLEEGKHPRRVMAAFANRFGDDSAEVDVLRILGLFSSPADKDEIAAVRAAPSIPDLTEHIPNLSETEWLGIITKLRHLKLLAPESRHRPDALDAHPLVREHFCEQLKQEYPEAWHEGNNRLYEYYKLSAKELPDTLEEMTPLFAAVMHGCQAGRYQEALDEVYWKRINRRNVAFNKKQLGALGAEVAALSSFFYGTSWLIPVDGLSENAKGYVFNEAGYGLRTLGRLAEAAQPMQASLELAIAKKSWNNAAVAASNLSELYLTIGDVKGALAYAEQSVGLADKSGDEFQRISKRTTFADALHQAGSLVESQASFHESEEMQKKFQPDLPLLYSLWGFRYCDLLLSQENYREVKRRASRTLEWAGRQSLVAPLVAGLDNLSLGRAQTAFTLDPSTSGRRTNLEDALIYLNRAMGALRQAGDQTVMPRGLLARAAYYRVTGDLDKAGKDLDEAFLIASRGGMRLYLADCHLEYARLALAKGEKDKAREHWGTAKDSIEEMGYHRRDREVEEIEMSLRGTA